MAEEPVARQRFRVGGSGLTVFRWRGSPIKFCRTLNDTAPTPVGAGFEAIHPMDARHPIDIVFARAHGFGTMTLDIYEEWDREVWRRLSGFETGRINDIVDVFDRSADLGGVTCIKLIKGPRGIRRAVQYHGCYITNLDLGENISIETLSIGRPVTITYTHNTRLGGRRNVGTGRGRG